MSPELERILQALWERNNATGPAKDRWNASFRRLVDDAVASRPGTSRREFMDALWDRYEDFRRARGRTTTLPPTA